MTNKDIRINGAGMTAGGDFRKVIIRGEGSITTDLKCAEFICRGSGRAMGQMMAENVRVAGQANFHDDVQAKNVRIFGQTEFLRNVQADDFGIWGQAEVQGNVQAERVRIKGRLTVQGDVEAERFEAIGAFEVNGLLNAGTIQISVKSFGPSKVKEIGGDEIIVKRRKGLIGLLHSRGILNAETIEGDEIYLEFTKAKTVRGTNVRLGPGCDIETVEYKTHYHAHEDSVVQKYEKV
jgi:cytoskeletal protein CcmA (bactofilin family)